MMPRCRGLSGTPLVTFLASMFVYNLIITLDIVSGLQCFHHQGQLFLLGAISIYYLLFDWALFACTAIHYRCCMSWQIVGPVLSTFLRSMPSGPAAESFFAL